MTLPCVLAGTAGVALAHAQYGSSTPAANSTVSAVPQLLLITYTQELADEQVTVTGPDGSNVTTAPATFDLENRHNASVPLRDAGPGVYTVVWHNVSGDDGDPNDGTFVFTEVAPPAPQGGAPTPPSNNPATPPSPPASAAASTASTPTPTATQAPTPAVTCVDNGVKTPGINDVRADTYCKRQAIRDLFKGKIDNSGFNYSLAIGEGLESALSDSCTVDPALCVLPKGFGLGH
ncbi:MAG: copper resistance protein CopC [Chloroflexi bacterium]|nr:copper resistance protein CopC [Chloroflexota bacterium]